MSAEITKELRRHHHTKDDGSWWEHDARGIPLDRVCELCREAKLSKYKPEVLTNSSYYFGERIEEDDPY
tara:strand:+ start:43 stop:249 length:207 start_codon:yes stop_codon:yes gene_type:complete